MVRSPVWPFLFSSHTSENPRMGQVDTSVNRFAPPQRSKLLCAGHRRRTRRTYRCSTLPCPRSTEPAGHAHLLVGDIRGAPSGMRPTTPASILKSDYISPSVLNSLLVSTRSVSAPNTNISSSIVEDESRPHTGTVFDWFVCCYTMIHPTRIMRLQRQRDFHTPKYLSSPSSWDSS